MNRAFPILKRAFPSRKMGVAQRAWSLQGYSSLNFPQTGGWHFPCCLQFCLTTIAISFVNLILLHTKRLSWYCTAFSWNHDQNMVLAKTWEFMKMTFCYIKMHVFMTLMFLPSLWWMTALGTDLRLKLPHFKGCDLEVALEVKRHAAVFHSTWFSAIMKTYCNDGLQLQY